MKSKWTSGSVSGIAIAPSAINLQATQVDEQFEIVDMSRKRLVGPCLHGALAKDREGCGSRPSFAGSRRRTRR